MEKNDIEKNVLGNITEKLILCSSSPSRKRLLGTCGFKIHEIITSDIDETPLKNEKPRDLAIRLAKEKTLKVVNSVAEDKRGEFVFLGADTVACRGRRIADKALTDDDVRNNLLLLSGRNVDIYSAFCVIKWRNGEDMKITQKVEYTRMKLKKLSAADIELIIKSGEGIGKGGGFSSTGLSQIFIISVVGTISCIEGLPMRKVSDVLQSFGIKPDTGILGG